MQITGTIKQMFSPETKSEKFTKQDVVVTDSSSKYPQDILIQFSNDKIKDLDKFKEGDQVEVSINLRGREWTSPQGEIKYFNTIEGWKITNVNGAASSSSEQANDNSDLPWEV